MVTPPRGLPWLARWLVGRSPVRPEAHAEVQADLHELFLARRRQRGVITAHWRLYHDVASLWLQNRPTMPISSPRSRLAVLADAAADLVFAARLFGRQPAVLLLTVAGLSLGLGISTAAFSIMNAAVLRGEGVLDPDRAPGLLRTTDRSVATAWSYDEFVHLRDGSTRMQLEAVLPDAAIVRTAAAETDAPSASVAFVSGGFFAATGGRVIAGRALEPADEAHADAIPVVASFAFWTSRLHRDPQAVGRAIHVGRTTATIVGVAERGFSAPGNRLLWMPLTAYRAVYDAGPTTSAANAAAPVRRTPEAGLQLFGRLQPGVSLKEAEAQLSAVAAALPPTVAAGEGAPRVTLDPHLGLGRMDADGARLVALFVFAVIALVLLLACANVAMVLVATAITREREMGVRAALGATRSRIVRQLITESLALGVVAAAIGLLLARWAIPSMAAALDAPAATDLAPDLRVYLFLGLVTLATGVGAGLAPAWHGRGADLLSPLKGDSARANRAGPKRLRSMLVITQAAVSVLLIVLATLFMRATFRAAAVDVGFEVQGLYAVSLGGGDAAGGDGTAMRQFWAEATAGLPGMPGVASVALAELTPFDGIIKTSITRDQPPRAIQLNRTGAEYFATVGLPLLAGRAFTPDEVAAGSPVAVVSQSLARAYWPDRSPLGEAVPPQIPLPPSMAAMARGNTAAPSPRPVVIGVVGDAITGQLHERGGLAVYEPLAPGGERFAQMLVRIHPGATGAIQGVSQRLRSIDPQADVRIASVDARVAQEARRPRLLAALTGIVGIIAVVLCVIGLYGLTAAVVGQRAREMGVRVAMGAAPADLLRLLMRDSLRPVVLGLAVGAGAALLISRVVVRAMLFGVSPQDPIAYGGAAAILLAAATLAVLVPTRRAAAVDAAFVLRM